MALPVPAGVGNQVSTPSPSSTVAASPERARIDMPRIAALAVRAGSMVEQIRGRLLAPEARKVAPVYSTAQLAALCGVDKAHVAYRITKEDLPSGRLTPAGGKRNFELSELRAWTRTYRADKMRPAGKKAFTIAVGNFKGGVAKTTTAMVLAQGLSLRGHRVLAIDTDPQGSLTTLHGLLPEAEISEDMTIAPLCDGSQSDIRYAIRSTYWDGLDLVAAAPFLFSAEFALPARQMQEPGARFWDVLNAGLESVRDLYDVIIIDTPPSLSYVTINALWAANGIVVPVPPSGLDFASSAQFWSLLADLGANLDAQGGDMAGKAFDFLHVLLSRVDPSDPATPAVRQWIQATYGEYTLPVEIPKTSVTSNKAAEFATVYDVQKYEGAAKTYKRASDAYDAFVDLVEQSVVSSWADKAQVQ
ncbi:MULTISPECIES: AAA family ATPase [Variovorax]|uniref:AAA family ATPase n=1 Tax=Variovorax TaxID=34072 RepID=UPI0004764236|nr:MULTISPECIES: AAA family ATPase [Variovorax]MBB3641809.1 chromosome partitioning protein [Variovorax sp. BK613]MDR6520746.1 chromosome partitioning protein [Variovorax paradoxus]RTD84242.1 cobyrinic acid a,c-diamide synthase [Variovorax sp. 369]